MKRLLVVLVVAVLATILGQRPDGADAHLPVPGTSLRVTWDVSHLPGPDMFRYTYTIYNGGAAAKTVRLTLSEYSTVHTGLHDESSFMTGGSAFTYDKVLTGFPAHNYDWTAISVPASSSVTVGFRDVHGPASRASLRVAVGATVNVFTRIPVPKTPAPVISLPLGGGAFKAYTHEGSAVVPASSGSLWQYKYFLRNTGTVTIGPPPASNHADYYLNESAGHAGIHHEVYNLADNGMATGFGLDSPGHGVEGLPAGIAAHQYYWEGIGSGPATWAISSVITLGFLDPHGPGFAPWGGRVVGSEATGFFDDDEDLVPVPDPAEPGPGVKPVGGIAELPDVAGTPLEAEGSSGLSAGGIAGVAAGVAALAVALSGGVWYVRRRVTR